MAETKVSDGAMRAAKVIADKAYKLHAILLTPELAEIIDRETGAADMLEALQLALLSVQEAMRKFASTDDIMWCNAEEVIVAAISRARGGAREGGAK